MAVLTGSLARRYARALIALATEANQVDVYGKDLLDLERTCQNLPGLITVLNDRFVSLSKRHKLLEDLVGQMKLAPLVRNFLLLLLEKGRVGLLPEIVKEYQVFQDQLQGIVRAVLVGARIPEAGVQQRVEALLIKSLKKKVVVRVEQDPKLIGGLLIKVGNRVYDGSVRCELDKIKETMWQQSLA